MGHTVFSAIDVQTQSGVCTLTLNRPEVRNAMSLTMVQELLGALRHAESTADVRVLVLRGAGGISAPVATSPTWRRPA